MYSNKYKWQERSQEPAHWIFKRVVNSEYKEHLVFQLVCKEDWNNDNYRAKIRRQHWNYYEGPESLESYLKRMEGNWDNPWIK